MKIPLLIIKLNYFRDNIKMMKLFFFPPVGRCNNGKKSFYENNRLLHSAYQFVCFINMMTITSIQ